MPEFPQQILQSAATGGTNEWLTPPEVFDPLHAEFGFGLDAAAREGSERLPNYISPVVDSLTYDWVSASLGLPIFLNPPYGHGLDKWIQKAAATGEHVEVVLLIYSITSTRAWHKHVMNAAEIRFIEGRVYFIAGEDIYKTKPDGSRVLTLRKGERGPATKDSSLVVFRPGHVGAPAVKSWKQAPRR